MNDDEKTKNDALNQDQPIQNETGLGEFLKKERNNRNITIEQVAAATKINIKLLHALEADEFVLLPAKPFVRGFITSYARYIGLDPNEVLGEFDDFINRKSVKKTSRSVESPRLLVGHESYRDNKKTALTIVIVCAFIATFAAFQFFKPSLKKKRSAKHELNIEKPESVAKVETTPEEKTETPVAIESETKSEVSEVKVSAKDKNTVEKQPKAIVEKAPEPEKKPEPPKEAAKVIPPEPKEPIAKKPARPVTAPIEKIIVPAVTPSPAQTSAPPQTSQPSEKKKLTIPPEDVKHVLIVRANEDCWVKYQSDKGPLKQYTLKAGQKIYIKARQSIRFKPGFPEGIELSVARGPFKPYPYGNSTKTLIIPNEIEDRYRSEPFIESERSELSTVNQ